MRTKTVLPPSGMKPFCACKWSRERNQKKYSRQLRRLYQLEWKLISCTPPWTTSAPVVRKAWSTCARSSGWTWSSASKTPTTSPRQCGRAVFMAFGLFFFSCVSTTTRTRGSRAAAFSATSVVSGSSCPTITMISKSVWLDSSSRWIVWSSTACSCRAGSSSEKDTCSSPSGLLNRVEASTSGVRQACICHHRVKAAIQNRASETAAMKTDVSKQIPPDPRTPSGDGGPVWPHPSQHCAEVKGEL